MRTSGTDSDFVLFMFPLMVLLVLSVLWMGGPTASLQVINRLVTEALAWLSALLR